MHLCTGTTFLVRKVLSSGLGPNWRHDFSNMEKSSYCCCCSHDHFNTGERNFHLSTPHSRPHTEQHTSPPKAEGKSLGRLLQELLLFLHCETEKTGEHRPASYSDQMWSSRRYSWNLNASLELFYTEPPKRDTSLWNRRRRGGTVVWTNPLTLHGVTVEEDCQDSARLVGPRPSPACSLPHGHTKENRLYMTKSNGCNNWNLMIYSYSFFSQIHNHNKN